jgi:hypothetical protein
VRRIVWLDENPNFIGSISNVCSFNGCILVTWSKKSIEFVLMRKIYKSHFISYGNSLLERMELFS